MPSERCLPMSSEQCLPMPSDVSKQLGWPEDSDAGGFSNPPILRTLRGVTERVHVQTRSVLERVLDEARGCRSRWQPLGAHQTGSR